MTAASLAAAVTAVTSTPLPPLPELLTPLVSAVPVFILVKLFPQAPGPYPASHTALHPVVGNHIQF